MPPVVSLQTRCVKRPARAHPPSSFRGQDDARDHSLVVTLLVLVPVIVCNELHSLNARLTVMTLAASLFVMLLSLLIKSKMIELAVAGAAYVYH